MAFDLPDWTKGVDIIAQTIASLRVDIVAQTIGNIAVDIAAQSVGNIAIDIAAQTMGNVAIDIAAQTVGNIAIDIAAQTVGNVAVNIAAQTVNLNIRTAGGVNIIIDLLTQTAYTEDRRTILNWTTTGVWTAQTGNNRAAKFFPRGCRGFIESINMYCRDNAAAGGTITIYITPYIGAGYLYTQNIAVPPAGAAAWRSATFNVMWNYDSLFIFWVMSNADTQITSDAITPYDCYTSADAGVTWTATLRRQAAQITMKGETVGDVPVSGTINTIEIPSVGSEETPAGEVIPNLGTADIVTIIGAGTHVHTLIRTTHDKIAISVYCDGNVITEHSIEDLNTWGFAASTPMRSVTLFTDNDVCVLWLTAPYKFRREFRVRAYNFSGGVQTVTVGSAVNLIR